MFLLSSRPAWCTSLVYNSGTANITKGTLSQNIKKKKMKNSHYYYHYSFLVMLGAKPKAQHRQQFLLGKKCDELDYYHNHEMIFPNSFACMHKTYTL